MTPAATLSCVPEQGWAEFSEACIHCKGTDYQEGRGPRTLLLCSCCRDRAVHISCQEAALGRPLSSDEVDAEWHCSEAGYLSCYAFLSSLAPADGQAVPRRAARRYSLPSQLPARVNAVGAE